MDHRDNCDEATKLPWLPAADHALEGENLARLRTAHGVSVFFPAYNDADSIGVLIDYSLRMLSEICADYEVLVVNDGSSDHTAEVLTAWQQRDPHVRIITHHANRGYGGALISGFQNSTKELIFYTDGDGQYDPTELLKLLPQIEDSDVVQGYKIVRSDVWYRTIIGRVYHRVAKLAFGLRLRDVDCDFRLMRRAIFDQVQLECNFGFICTEMMKKIQDAGFRVVEVPVHHYPRVFGHSMFFRPRRLMRIMPVFLLFWWRLVLLPAIGWSARGGDELFDEASRVNTAT